jgi:hypothetical protein
VFFIVFYIFFLYGYTRHIFTYFIFVSSVAGGHHLELGASWIHGILGNPLYEMALSHKLVDINHQPKPRNVVALTETGQRVPFRLVQVTRKFLIGF